MDTFEAYAPPKAAVIDAAAEPPKIPLAFKIFLVTFVLLDVLGTLAGGLGGGFVWAGVLAIAAWRTLAGSRPASRVLGGLLVLMSLLSVVAAVPLLHSRPVAAYVMLLLVAYMLGLVAYLFFSPTMQAVYRKADARKWSGG
jgi:hypothetical protein